MIQYLKKEKSTEIPKILGLINNKQVNVSHTFNFIFNEKYLLDYTNLFFCNKYAKRKHKFKLEIKKNRWKKNYSLEDIKKVI